MASETAPKGATDETNKEDEDLLSLLFSMGDFQYSIRVSVSVYRHRS